MEPGEFERVVASFAAFHREFAPLFGRREAQAHSEQYVRGLLVQQTDRRNAENLAEAVDGVSARALQRFVTDAPWETGPVLERLQRFVGQRLSSPHGVWVVDESGFPKAGQKSVGVRHQYCGRVGKVTNCQMGVFLAYVSERGRALVDGRLYLPEVWTEDPARCRAAGVPAGVEFATKAELALAQLRQARTWGHLHSPWVTADAGYGEAPSFRDALDTDGFLYVLEVPLATPVFTTAAEVAVPAWTGRGRKPTLPRLVAGSSLPQTAQAVAAPLEPQDWQELTVAEGAQGPRTYQFAGLRVWESRAGLPGRPCWLVLRRNLDGAELKAYLANGPADTELQTLAQVSAWRWPIETEFQTTKSETGLDEYEVRSWRGWHHHITLSLLAGAFLLQMQQDWGGKDAPDHASSSQPRAARPLASAPLDRGGPARLAAVHSRAQRAGQTIPHQAPSAHAA